MVAPFYRDTWVEINLKNIQENVRNMKKHLPDETTIIAVVKANGYGHGAVEVANAALEAGATNLAVALLDEALELREKGITAPILVLGRTRPEDARVALSHEITLTVFQLDWLERAKEDLSANGAVRFHLKVDTGMGRIGVKEKAEVDDILDFISLNTQFKMTGMFTHFATADAVDVSYFQTQYERFITVLEWVKERGVHVDMIHCANSATGLRFPDKAFNAVRFGIAMYGLTPSIDINGQLPFPLREAFSLKSKLVHVKQISAGDRVSYGGTYCANENEWIGTVPIGYADGWIRKLNSSFVLVGGRRCPIVGRICMDQMMVRLPMYVPVDTVVTLIGKQEDEEVSVDEIAKVLGTINYEIPCMITSRVPRVYIRE